MERAAWREESVAIHASRLVFLDESGAHTAMDRTYGRAASGKRVAGPVPHGHCSMTTLTAAVRLDGLVPAACQASSRATNAAWFVHYLATCLVPSLRVGDIEIMDNLSSHKSAEVTRLIESAGAQLRILPACNPS